MDCKSGLLDLKNEPHKIFSFDDYLVIDWWCAEFQYLVHEKIESKPYATQLELNDEDLVYLLENEEECEEFFEQLGELI